MKKNIEKKIIFPALNLTAQEWDFSTLNDIKLEGQFYLGSNDLFFNKYYLESLFIDVKGNLYKIIGKEDVGKWRKYIPFFMKSKISFEDLNSKIPLNEVKTHIINKIKNIKYSDEKNDKFLTEWIKRVEDSKSMKELLEENM
ncbi:hypothetical protein [Changchengzhania lutea]|uniref:hypothetical protein n=1 Tax=Changchengzhania lutea TaxID=2049305 RepID=UPI00115E4C36|nr:hypothetical protein [Changchengzhania lutea]